MPNQLRKVSLQFPSLKQLIDYTLTVDVTKCEIIRSTFTLICELTDADIELAKHGFGALDIE